jgi:type I restriction enzyme R subunit
VGAGKGKEEKVPLSEPIRLLNERFGTQFTRRIAFHSYRLKKARTNEQVIQTALVNPLDNFELDIPKLVEDFMIDRLFAHLRKVLESKVIASARRVSNHFALT